MPAPGWPPTPHIVCGHARQAVSLSPVPKTGKKFTDQQADQTANPTHYPQTAQATELTFIHSSYSQIGQSVDIPFIHSHFSTISATTQSDISSLSTQPTRKFRGPATVKNYAAILRYRNAASAPRRKSQGLY